MLVSTILSAGLVLAQPQTFDAYLTGIRVAEIRIDAAGYSIRKRDPASNRWSAEHRAPASAAAADTAFSLGGAARTFLARLGLTARVDWKNLELVGWPDRTTIYERHHDLTATVAGRPATATLWALRDGSRPLDLVIGPDNRLLAAIDPGTDYVLVRRGYENFTTVGQWRAPEISQPLYGYRSLGKQMVPMKDGVGLATLVYLPDGPAAKGPFPVVFFRTPYGIGHLIGSFWHYAARGYAVVFQSTRGTSFTDPANRSEGIWQPVINEPADGAEAIEWITRQPWSAGKICMQGGSYVGYTQWAAAMAANPALKCLIPESSMGTTFSDQPYMAGTFVEGMAFYMFWMLEQQLAPGRTWTEVLHHRPLTDLDNFALGHNLPQWDEMVEHSTNDDYWARQDWYRGTQPRNLSALMISGWWDDDFPGTESNWAMMSRYGVGPQHLIIGPWKHGYNADRMLNGYRFGNDAVRSDVWLEKQRWYDHFLKGMGDGVAGAVATYFVLGANEWRTASAWPPKEARRETWYLHSDGDAARLATSGTLTPAPAAADEPTDRYQYDPKNPPPNWVSFDQMLRWEDVQDFPWDMKDIEGRPDVATFTSAPLDHDVTIAGELTAVIYASTDVKDTDWWVHISDVDPQGRSHRITQGAVRARFRDNADPQHHIFGTNFQAEHLLSGNPADVIKYEIGIRSIANRFAKGHRIRIAVMNALDNYSFPNSNTGQHEAHVTETVIGNMAVHHTAAYPSHVILPVLDH